MMQKKPISKRVITRNQNKLFKPLKTPSLLLLQLQLFAKPLAGDFRLDRMIFFFDIKQTNCKIVNFKYIYKNNYKYIKFIIIYIKIFIINFLFYIIYKYNIILLYIIRKNIYYYIL